MLQTIFKTGTLDFTADERKQIDNLKQELDLTDSVTAVEFGIGCQRQLAEFADRVLENSCNDNTDAAEQLQALIDEIKALDAGFVFKDTFWSRIPIIGSRARRMKFCIQKSHIPQIQRYMALFFRLFSFIFCAWKPPSRSTQQPRK